ncbi:MAG: hypothetical protein IJB84_01905 [Lachnospiraceae bacterium]|nr:hypothetical protein [Lachnospiraceae bacterium]
MKRRMRVVIQKVLCAMMAACVLFAGADSMMMKAQAAELGVAGNVDVLESELIDMTGIKPTINGAKTALVNCTISFSKSSSGLHIEITTGCGNGVASYLGIKDVKIEQKVWYGWKTIATGSGGQQSNCSIMGISIDYPNVTAGETYRISCVHYGNYDGYHELSNQTSEFVY